MEQDQAMRVVLVASGSVKQECGGGKSQLLDSQGYVLRENPKKSTKFSDFGHNVDGDSTVQGKKVQCKICGKEFASSCSLNGHLRHHSGEGKNWVRCDLCGSRFRSVRCLSGHMKVHSRRQLVYVESEIIPSHSNPVAAAVSDPETMNLVRKRRSKRARYKFTASSSDLSGFSGSLSVSGFEFEFDHVEEEVAESLLLLSSGAGTSGSSTFISDSLGSTRTFVSCKDGSLPEETGVDVYDDNENVKMEKVKEGQSCSSADSEMVVDERDQISCDKSEVVYLEAQLDPVSELASRVGEEGIGFRCEANKDGGDSLRFINSVSSCDMEMEKHAFDRKMGDSPLNFVAKVGNGSEVLKFKCKICSRMFATHQSLGGHQTSHRMTKCSISMKTEVCEYIGIIKPDIVLQVEAANRGVRLDCAEVLVEQKMDGAKEVHHRLQTPKEFKCSICCKIFASGQALGGHKRAHWASKARDATEHDVSGISELTNFVIPCLVDREANHDTQLKPSWSESSCKHEVPVAIIGS